jgi:ketosteroid isomerase-like protein
MLGDAGQPASEDAMAPQSFDDAVETARRNLRAMAQGNAAPTIALLSQRDDVVLANPLGPPIVGFASVAAEAERVASMFIDGEPTVFDEVARWVSDDLGYVVAIEHARVKRSGSEAFVPMDLRVTTIFRRESDGWRLCVRHADRVTGLPIPTG